LDLPCFIYEALGLFLTTKETAKRTERNLKPCNAEEKIYLSKSCGPLILGNVLEKFLHSAVKPHTKTD
jgi:hypothetical protein